MVGKARPSEPVAPDHGLLPLPDLLHAGAVAEDPGGGRLRQSVHFMNPTLENFEELFERKSEVRGFVGDALRRSYPFLDWLANTLFIFAGSLAATLWASVPAAYALGRRRPPGFRWWRRARFSAYVGAP